VDYAWLDGDDDASFNQETLAAARAKHSGGSAEE